ncbi:hypothetical protein [Natrialba hulunbeirensis]|uniref:hypothetical protein n=1 Tax=Natrialba hulunbeirensis TaxID=123783 RepID=UPI0012687E3F|nr:hypothetical protein [Natrialba hulunbeirensis]
MREKTDKIIRRNVLKKVGASSIGIGAIAGSASANASGGNNSDSDDEVEPQGEGDLDSLHFVHDPVTKVVDEYYTGDDIVEVNVTAKIEADETFRPSGSQSALTFFWEESSWTLHDPSGFKPEHHCNNRFKEEIGSHRELDGDELVNPDAETNHGDDPDDFDRFSIVWENAMQTYNCTSDWFCNGQDKSYGAYESVIWARIYLLNQNSNNSPGDINVEAAYLPTGSFDVVEDISISAGGVVSYSGLGGWFNPSEATEDERMYCCDEDGGRISSEDI